MPKSKSKSPAIGAGSSSAELFYSDRARDDYAWWRRHNPAVANRIDRLISDTIQHPFTGLGKPEPLRFELKGAWSRRITGEHRMVYRFEAGRLYIAQLRFHY